MTAIARGGRSQADGTRDLRAAGLIPTAQRRAVLAALVGRSRPVTAQHVHTEMGRAGRRIGLSTVYRTLHDLADAGLLHTFSLDDGRAYRYCSPAAHQHLVCDRCGTVTECPRELVDAWLVGVRESTGFRPRPELIDIPGICERCMLTS
jgi:Fe2+ or Zn2+ uptake regulation protein